MGTIFFPHDGGQGIVDQDVLFCGSLEHVLTLASASFLLYSVDDVLQARVVLYKHGFCHILAQQVSQFVLSKSGLSWVFNGQLSYVILSDHDERRV